MMTAEQEKERKLAEIARRYGFAARGPAPADPAPAEPVKADTRRKPTRSENQLMMILIIMRNGLMKYAEAMRERCKEAGKYTWRDMRLLLRLITKVQEQLMRTMPDSRIEYYQAYVANGRYTLEIAYPVRMARHIAITDVHLGAICDAAICGECALCAKDGREAERCTLREALLEVAPPERFMDPEALYAECEYRKVAQQMLLGEKIEI